MYQNIATKVLTGEVRLSYEHLMKPYAQRPGEQEKYSVTLLIPKSDTATYNNIMASIEAAAEQAVSKSWGGTRPPVLPQPLHDGDGVRDNGTPYGPECRGYWVMTASSKNKPGVVHQSDLNTDLLPQDVYSGMWARVTLNFFAYNSNGRKGVGCGLGNVMKTRDDEPFSGGASAASDFAGVGNIVSAPAAQAAFPQTGIDPLTGMPMAQEAIPF